MSVLVSAAGAEWVYIKGGWTNIGTHKALVPQRPSVPTGWQGLALRNGLENGWGPTVSLEPCLVLGKFKDLSMGQGARYRRWSLQQGTSASSWGLGLTYPASLRSPHARWASRSWRTLWGEEFGEALCQGVSRH